MTLTHGQVILWLKWPELERFNLLQLEILLLRGCWEARRLQRIVLWKCSPDILWPLVRESAVDAILWWGDKDEPGKKLNKKEDIKGRRGHNRPYILRLCQPDRCPKEENKQNEIEMA